ncbi:MAG TPA: hypothetical protein VKJ47_18055 [Candidatus Binatia bacterium]|nr:hypothetical protein [Candidatus Binatia bacterium]
MQWLIPIVMGLWAIWTWTQEWEQGRATERARLAALYVNPFLSACEDLQSRIYHILELGGLRTLRKRYPDGFYAEETLYLIVRYFGWAAAMHRYSPYAQDPVVTRLAETVRDAFATTDGEFPVGPFNFFHPEQKALGKMVMSRMEGQHGIELDTISSYEFKERLASPPLCESQSVQQSLAALRNTEDAKNLPGRKRLEKAQNHLVDLLLYLEGKEGYSLFTGERKKCSSVRERGAVNNSQPVQASERPARPNRKARPSRTAAAERR